MSDGERHTGRVKWFDPKRGFGFIVGPNEQDVFVHYTSIVDEGFKVIHDGALVTYELYQGDKGWLSRNVKAVAGAPRISSTAAAKGVVHRGDAADNT